LNTWKKGGYRHRKIGPQSVSQSLQHVFIDKLSHVQLLTYQLLTHWKEIVGEETAKTLMPIKTLFQPRTKKEILIVCPQQEGVSFFFQYQKNALLEKINNYFGQEVYDEIRLSKTEIPLHRPAWNSPKKPHKNESPLPPLSKDVEAHLATIKDETLRKKLVNLYSSL
tara:strand:- start:128 stop:628 length:501 start_codon:yes stop_codon:yes gene_type:complete